MYREIRESDMYTRLDIVCKEKLEKSDMFTRLNIVCTGKLENLI